MAPERSPRPSRRRTQRQESRRRTQRQESPRRVSMRLRSMKDTQRLDATLPSNSASNAPTGVATKGQGRIFNNDLARHLPHEPLASNSTNNSPTPVFIASTVQGTGRIDVSGGDGSHTAAARKDHVFKDGFKRDPSLEFQNYASGSVFSGDVSGLGSGLHPEPLVPHASISIPAVSIPTVNASTPTADVSIPKLNASIPKPDVSIPKPDVTTPFPDDTISKPDASVLTLPPKPLVPQEIPTSDFLIEIMERKSFTSKRLFDEQQANIKFIEEYVEILAQQCEDNEEILRLKQFMDKLEHTCLSCHDLAWNPHILACGHTVCLQCISNARRQYIRTGNFCSCPTCGFPVCRQPIPSLTVSAAVESLFSSSQVLQSSSTCGLETMSKKRKGFEEIFQCDIRAGRKIRNLQSYTPSNLVGPSQHSSSSHQHPSSSQQHPSSSQQHPSSQHLPSPSSSQQQPSSSQQTDASVHVPPPSPGNLVDGSRTPGYSTSHPAGVMAPLLSQNVRRPLVAAESSSNSPSLGAGNVDHGLTVMASTILNRDIDFSRPAGTITLADLDQLAVLAEDAVMQQADFMDNHGLSTIFDGRQNRTITQASQRLQSLSQSAQSHLALLQNLSSISDPSNIQKTLLDAEQAIAAIGAHLVKRQRKELQTEVDEVRLVVRNVENSLKGWRVLHPDNSPMKLDN
ncbi:hypothetical protein F5878DRAFT_647479, partial [Lentinula raphanica]